VAAIMSRYIAFLRAINVGGHVVKMEALREHFETLGFDAVETFIASGNVIFQAKAGKVDALQRKIEAHLQKALGYEVATFIRTDAEVAAAAQYQPFKQAVPKVGVLHVAFLEEPLDASAQQILMKFKTEVDEFHVNRREIYWWCKLKQSSDSAFNNARFEKALQTRATWRNINTVVRLAAKYPPKG
jgi:uncharacterized protein (DUF1697 family)